MRTSMIIRSATLLPFLILSACAGYQQTINPEVSDYINLLIKIDEPTLAEYANFSGECGGESELDFALQECRSKGWGVNSPSCVNFTQQRCASAKQEASLELRWLRSRFSTVGKRYRLVDTRSISEGFSHEMIEVEIGGNSFLLFHNTDPNVPTGVVVGVSEVNGRRIADYMADQ